MIILIRMIQRILIAITTINIILCIRIYYVHIMLIGKSFFWYDITAYANDFKLLLIAIFVLEVLLLPI